MLIEASQIQLERIPGNIAPSYRTKQARVCISKCECHMTLKGMLDGILPASQNETRKHKDTILGYVSWGRTVLSQYFGEFDCSSTCLEWLRVHDGPLVLVQI